MTIMQKSFEDTLKSIGDFAGEKKLAVALSGGGDSIALAHLMSGFCRKHDVEFHALTVDHGLRAESAKEAKTIGKWVKIWPDVIHKILKWTGDKPKTRIQEEARKVRYALISSYCKKHKIKYLFLAHHGGDQIETFLFRLAKGSGLDGLSVMPPMQEMGDIVLVRPLLNYTHKDMIETCRKNKLNWVEDPSNEADKYARVRLRNSREVLEKEGLSAERILTLGKRLSRARVALNQIADKAFELCFMHKEKAHLELNLAKFLDQPDEIGIRILQKAMEDVAGAKKYPPSLQILEEITERIYRDPSFRAATLGGCIIRRRKSRGLIEIRAE